MFWVSRIFELLSATKKLNASKAHVMNAVSGLTVVLLLGVFGTFLSALMIGGLLWLIYTQMILAGVSVVMAALGTAALTLAVLAAIGLIASALFGRVREDVESIFRSQAPMVAPVIDKMSNMAESFFNGLRTSHGVPPKSDKSRR